MPSWPSLIGCLVCVLCLSSGKAQAQQFGILGGTTFAKINVSGNEPLNAAFREKWEPLGGVFVAFPLGERVSIDPEVFLNRKGSRFTYDVVRENVRLLYIDVPVIVRYAPPDDSPLRWLRVIGGPYVSYLLNAESESRDGSRTTDLDDTIRSIDFGWLGGLGIHAGGFDFDARYGGGIIDIGDRKRLVPDFPALPTEGLKYRTRLFEFLIRRRL